MKTKKITANDFIKVVEWSDKDKCYVGAALPYIGQCCHGDNDVQVYKQLGVIIDDCVDFYNKNGIVPKGYPMEGRKFSGKFPVRIKPELHRAAVIRATIEGESLNRLVEKALEKIV